MAEATRLKMRLRGHLEWQHLLTKFHENPLIGSKVISGGHADRQAGDLMHPLSFFESRLKIMHAQELLSGELCHEKRSFSLRVECKLQAYENKML
jgi:hypothetical protein